MHLFDAETRAAPFGKEKSGEAYDSNDWLFFHDVELKILDWNLKKR